ncbi:MAG: diguanylate cyclase [Pseudomonadota bacterium]
MHIPPAEVLIAARDPQDAANVAALLASGGGAYLPILSAGPQEFLALAEGGGAAVALLVLSEGGEASRQVQELRLRAPGLPLVVLLATGAARFPDLARQALASGAQDCLVLGGLEAAGLARALDLAPARLKALEQAGQEGQRQRSIVEHLTELVCRFLPDGTLTFSNQAYRGYFSDITLGQGSGNLFECMPPADGQRLKRLLANLTPQHPLGRSDQAYTTPDGQTRWQSWSHWGIFDPAGKLAEVQAVGRDVTERKQVERALQVVEANLRQLIVDNADGLIVADRQGLVLFVNPAAEGIMARRSWDLVGQPFSFPLVTGQRGEMCLMAGPEQKVVVEVRVVDTTWQGQPAFLASLRDITELAKLREELRALSLVDELTGLYNRRGFLTLASQQILNAQRMSRRLHLFFIDLDDLKLINDRLGHTQGDRALVAASQVLKSTFRGSDIVARVGGDEFAALALEVEGRVEEAILLRLKQNLAERNQKGLEAFRLSLSVGATAYDPAAPRSMEELLMEADRRMYSDKRGKSHSVTDQA